MTYANEFPDFPAAAVPPVVLGEGWQDASWHNDACPFFIHHPSGVGVWCDYPEASDRDMPNNDRFYAVALAWDHDANGGDWMHDAGSDGPLLGTDSADELAAFLPTVLPVRAIAHAFATAIETECADDLATIRARNASPDYEGLCASHDFCDANMPMLAAFEQVMGRPIRFNDDTPEGEAASNEDFALMGAAWDIARKERLTGEAGASEATGTTAAQFIVDGTVLLDAVADAGDEGDGRGYVALSDGRMIRFSAEFV